MTDSITDEIVEKAFLQGRLSRIKASSNARPDGSYEISDGDRVFMRAALSAVYDDLVKAERGACIKAVTDERNKRASPDTHLGEIEVAYEAGFTDAISAIRSRSTKG